MKPYRRDITVKKEKSGNMKKLLEDFMESRAKRLITVFVLILLSLLLLSGIYLRWIPRREKKLTVGVFAGSYWEIENGHYYQILDDAIREFQKRYPEYEVTYTSGILKSDYSEWLSEKIMQGQAPDLFFVPSEDLSTFAQLGALKPLDKLIALDHDFSADAFYPSAWEFGQEKGEQLAVPYECAPNMMFVNKTILDREGIALPDPDWTWEDFLDICRKVTRSTDGTGFVNQFGVSGYSWVDAFNANGVKLFHEGGTSCDFTTEEIGQAISFLESLQNINSGYNVSGRDFSNGNVAFQPMMLSEYRAYKSRELSLKKYSGFEWECITMPAGPSGDNISRLDTLCVALSRKTSQEKKSWELLKILTSEEKIQREIFDYSEGISPLVEVTQSRETADMILEKTGTEFNMDTLRHTMEKAVTAHRFPGYEGAREEVSLAVRSILESSSNVRMEQIIWNRRINNYLKSGK